MTPIRLQLPWPPAVNNLFATVKAGKKQRRIRTRRYEAWLAEAGACLLTQPWRPIEARAKVSLLLTPPDNRERDADGYLKAPIDLLVKAGVLAGDSMRHVKSATAEWSDSPPAKPGQVIVTLEAAQ